MYGFPPVRFEPQLITVMSDPNAMIKTISFYIKLGEETHSFWIIPDLRGTEFAELTLQAIQILVLKWSDHSLFKGSFPGPAPDIDIFLIFSPIALYVFEQNANSLNPKHYPLNIKDQARYLQEQIHLLRKCS